MSDQAPRFSWQAQTLHLRNPFRLSYGVSETRQAFWLRLAGDVGWGEAAIPPYYGISDEAMIGYWAAHSRRGLPFPNAVSEIQSWVGTEGPAPARCALDLAAVAGRDQIDGADAARTTGGSAVFAAGFAEFPLSAAGFRADLLRFTPDSLGLLVFAFGLQFL